MIPHFPDEKTEVWRHRGTCSRWLRTNQRRDSTLHPQSLIRKLIGMCRCVYERETEILFLSLSRKYGHGIHTALGLEVTLDPVSQTFWHREPRTRVVVGTGPVWSPVQLLRLLLASHVRPRVQGDRAVCGTSSRSHLCLCGLSQMGGPGDSLSLSAPQPQLCRRHPGLVILGRGMALSWVWCGAGQRKVRTLLSPHLTQVTLQRQRLCCILPFSSHTNPALANYNLDPNTGETLGNVVPTGPS